MSSIKEKIGNSKRKIYRILFSTIGISSSLFVFQACYGSKHDEFAEPAYIAGSIVSKKTGLPVVNAKVGLLNRNIFTYTNEKGHFEMYVDTTANIKLHISDLDGQSNGLFLDKDTILHTPDKNLLIVLDEVVVKK